MRNIAIEVEEAAERLHELTDAVLQGHNVWITEYGEPIAVATLQHAEGEEAPAGLREAVLALLEGAVRHLRDRRPPQPWCLN